MAKMGRKTKLTHDLIKKARALLEQGNYERVVYQALGIPERTWYDWKRWGEEQEDTIYSQFSQMIKEAEAKAHAYHLNIIAKAAVSGNWTASAWFLERKFPEEWGRKDNKIELETKAPLKLEVVYVRAKDKQQQDKEANSGATTAD